MTPKSRRLLLLPTTAWGIGFIVLPFLIVLLYSFAKRGPYGEVIMEPTLANYRAVGSMTHLKVAWFSIRLAFWNTLFCLGAAYPVAYLLAQIERPRLKYFLLLLILIPFWTNFLIRTFALAGILGDEGILNRSLLALGWIDDPLDLIYSKKAMVLGLLSNYLPFMVLPLFVSLEKQDRSLLEAALDLGASPFRAFARVTWPLSLPGVAAGCLMVFIPSLGEFVIPDLLGGGRYLLLGNLLQQKFLITRDWPLGSALSVVLAILLILFLFLYYRLRERHADAI